MLYMVTFTINIPQMLAYIPYMDPMGYINYIQIYTVCLLRYQEPTGILPAVGLLHSLTTTCLGVLLMIELSKHKNHMVCLSL